MIHNFKNWNRLNETEVDVNKLMLKLLNNDVTSSYVITKIQEAIKNNFKTFTENGHETNEFEFFRHKIKIKTYWSIVIKGITVSKGGDNKLIARASGYLKVKGEDGSDFQRVFKYGTKLKFNSRIPVETVMADDGKNIKYIIQSNQISISTKEKEIKAQESGFIIKLIMNNNIATVKLLIICL